MPPSCSRQRRKQQGRGLHFGYHTAGTQLSPNVLAGHHLPICSAAFSSLLCTTWERCSAQLGAICISLCTAAHSIPLLDQALYTEHCTARLVSIFAHIVLAQRYLVPNLMSCAARVPGAGCFWACGLPPGVKAPEGSAPHRGGLQAAAGRDTLCGSRRPRGWQEFKVGVQVGLHTCGLARWQGAEQQCSRRQEPSARGVCDHLAKQRRSEAPHKIAGHLLRQSAT